MFCQQCGAENRTGARFCASCGALLNSNVDALIKNIHQSQNTRAFGASDIQSTSYGKQQNLTQGLYKRHWTATVAFVIWVLAIISNLYTTAFGYLLRYNPEVGVGLLLTILSAITAYNMYDADREGLYTGIAAILIALAWDIFLGNIESIVVVIVIAIFTIAASPHLIKDGIRVHNSKIPQGS